MYYTHIEKAKKAQNKLPSIRSRSVCSHQAYIVV